MARTPHSGGGGEHGGEGGDRRRRGRGRESENRQERGDDELKDKLVAHQPRRQGGEGWPSVQLCRPGRGRRPEGSRRLRRRQGARGAGGDPQGDRARQARHDPRADEGRPHAAPRHEGRFGAGKVVMRTAVAGTGIIAGGPLRAIFETLGMGDVVAKCSAAATRTTWSRRPSRPCPHAYPACGRAPARQEGFETCSRPRRPRPRQRRSRQAASVRRRKKTVKGDPDGVTDGPQAGPEGNVGRAWTEQDAAHAGAGGYALGARHDPQGCPPDEGGGAVLKMGGSPMRLKAGQTMKLNELRDNPGARSSRSGSGAGLARARARPPARASRARRHAPASR